MCGFGYNRHAKGRFPLPADLPPPAVETVVVSAARLPAPASTAVFSAVTIGGQALHEASRLDEALRQVPALSLFRRTTSLAANPTTQGVSLRAIAPSGAGRTLVTLDGAPQNDPFGGWVIWSALPPQAVENATVVRGAGAGPYGAGALTGTIALEESTLTKGFDADASAGERDSLGGAVVAARPLGALDLFATISGERSDGWVPVRSHRGAADAPLNLATWQTAARAQTRIGAGILAVHGGVYDDERGAGLVGAKARARGESISVAYAVAPNGSAPGWQLQAWLRDSDLENSSVAVAPDRSTTTPANDQYATPAFGWGVNAALRAETTHWEWEVGADARFADGETHEHFRFIAPAFTRNRIAGGENIVAGLYGEATWRDGRWRAVFGLRGDYWAASDAHRTERDLATGDATLDIAAPDGEGFVPTARAGARYDLGRGWFTRAAAYAGFRPPTLNELHRPFRVGNDITEANPLLNPERLYGVETALGGDSATFGWSATIFYNVLDDPITNVTIATEPGNASVRFGSETFLVLVPTGGVLRQRQNAGRIDAIGIEAEAIAQLSDTLEARLAAALTSARVDGGDAAPQLTGNRPAQAPRVSITGGADWRAAENLIVHADLRFESARFDDDLNTRRLAAAFTANLRADWRLSDTITVYGALENLTGAEIETARTAEGIVSLDQPRTFWIGLRYGM